VAQNIYITGTC